MLESRKALKLCDQEPGRFAYFVGFGIAFIQVRRSKKAALQRETQD
jgi:hypothetical protein